MKLTSKDMRTPFGTQNDAKIRAAIDKARSEQTTAATAAAAPMLGANPTDREGTVIDCYLVVSAAAAAGESMTYDVLLDGVSILEAPFVYDDGVAVREQVKMPLAVQQTYVPCGAVLTVSRTYVAGGAPTPMANNKVVVEWVAGGRL